MKHMDTLSMALQLKDPTWNVVNIKVLLKIP